MAESSEGFVEYQRNEKADLGREAEARSWIEKVIGREIAGGDDLVEDLRDGVALCELLERLSPGLAVGYVRQPKHYLDEHANLDKFIEGCKAIGVPSGDLTTKLDFSDSKRDRVQVVQNLFALGRQAQAIGFEGPILGKKYSVTREQQLALEAKKDEERRLAAEQTAVYENERRARRDFLEDEKKKRLSSAAEIRKSQRLSRREARMSSGRAHLKPNEHAYADKHEDDRPPSPVRYGMDLENELKRQEEEFEEENDLMNWIEDLTGVQVDSLFLSLRSGVLLCELMNKLNPGAIPKIAKPKTRWRASALPERENIGNFIEACRSLGIPTGNLFAINDLYERRDMSVVRNCLLELANLTALQPGYDGPCLIHSKGQHRKRPIDIDAELRLAQNQRDGQAIPLSNNLGSDLYNLRSSEPVPRTTLRDPASKNVIKPKPVYGKPKGPQSEVVPGPIPMSERRWSQRPGPLAPISETNRKDTKKPGLPVAGGAKTSPLRSNPKAPDTQAGEGDDENDLLVSPSPSPTLPPSACMLWARKFFKMMVALTMLLFVIITWIVQAEILQAIEQGSTKTGSAYNRPFFNAYVIGSAYALCLPVWAIWHFVVNRKKPEFSDPHHMTLRLLLQCASLSTISIFGRYSWYLSLPLTSVSANTAVYNSSSVFVFLFSIFIVKEKITVLKVLSVLVATGGVTLVSLFGSDQQEDGHVSTVMGFVWVIISTICWSLFQTLFAKYAKMDPLKGPERSFLYVGFTGVVTLLVTWPVIIILHYTGVEPFELPPPIAQYAMGINAVLDVILNAANFVGITFSSPLFMTVGTILTMPASIIADKVAHDFLLPPLAFVGMALISVGFLLLNLDEYLRLRRGEKEDGAEGKGTDEPINTGDDSKPLI